MFSAGFEAEGVEWHMQLHQGWKGRLRRPIDAMVYFSDQFATPHLYPRAPVFKQWWLLLAFANYDIRSPSGQNIFSTRRTCLNEWLMELLKPHYLRSWKPL